MPMQFELTVLKFMYEPKRKNFQPAMDTVLGHKAPHVKSRDRFPLNLSRVVSIRLLTLN